MSVSIKLLKGNCLELLKQIKDESIDLIVTDPPYNISQYNNFETMGRSRIDFGKWDHNADILSWIEDGSRILKKGGTMIVFNGWRNLNNIALKMEQDKLIVKDLIR